MDWLKSLAPLIGTALAGPLGGAAASFVADKLGLPDKTVAAVTELLSNGQLSPEQISNIKTAELEFQKFLEANKIKVHELENADRAGAREREDKTGDSFTPRALALVVTLGFFGVLGYLMVAGKPPEGGDAMMVMLGALGGSWTAIVSYYFGSSASSAQKTKLLADR
jgi:hypothetical protein